MYNPFKYWYKRTMWYARQPVTYVLDVSVLTVLVIVLYQQGSLLHYEIFIAVTIFWLVWLLFCSVLRFLCSIIVCWAARHHDGFKQEYYDCISGR